MTDTQTRLKEIHEAQMRMYETHLKPFADIDSTRGFTAEERENYEKWSSDFDDLEARAKVILAEHELEQRAIQFTADLLGNRSAFGSAADIAKFASEIRAVLNGEERYLDYVLTSNHVLSNAMRTTKGSSETRVSKPSKRPQIT